MDSYKAQIDRILIAEKKYGDPEFSATRLAEELGVSTYKLSRILKTEYGMTFHDIVHAYRIRNAMRYLKDRRFTPYSVDDIGEMVGFGNRQSFFSAFRKVTGTTPERFRQS